MNDLEREAKKREAKEREDREKEARDRDLEADLTDNEDMADFIPRTLREFNVPRAGDVRGAIRLSRVVGDRKSVV